MVDAHRMLPVSFDLELAPAFLFALSSLHTYLKNFAGLMSCDRIAGVPTHSYMACHCHTMGGIELPTKHGRINCLHVGSR